MVYKCYVKQILIACDYAIAFIFKIFSLRAQRCVADAYLLDRWMVAKYASYINMYKLEVYIHRAYMSMVNAEKSLEYTWNFIYYCIASYMIVYLPVAMSLWMMNAEHRKITWIHLEFVYLVQLLGNCQATLSSENLQPSKLLAAKGNCCQNCFPSKDYWRQIFGAESSFFEVQ